MDTQGTGSEQQKRASGLPERVRKAPRGQWLSHWAFDSHGQRSGGGLCGMVAAACPLESHPPRAESLLCDLR